MQQLQTLKAPPLGLSVLSEDDSVPASRELGRRRITSSSIKASQRKVFIGSRHTRALSLLSPRDPTSRSDLPLHGNGPSYPPHAVANDVAVPATVPGLFLLDIELGLDHMHGGRQKDVILETGKQLVGDFRQGLWTYFEDFKQLTVRDEGTSTAGPRGSLAVAPGNMPRRQKRI